MNARNDYKDDFKAYDRWGKLVLHIWTSSQEAFQAEKEAFQARLDRRELMRVDVCPANGSSNFSMYPRC